MCIKKINERKRLILFFTLCVSTAAVHAQSLSSAAADSNVLVVDEQMVETKVYTSFNYRSALTNYKINQRDSQFWTFLLPTASLSASQSYADKALTENYAGSSTLYQGKWVSNLSLGADLNVALANIINIPAIIDKYQNNKLTFEQTRMEIVNTAKTSFYTLIATRQQLDVLESSVNVAQSTYNQSVNSYNSGLVDRVTMLNAQYQYQMILNSLNAARTGYAGGLLQFKQLLGIPLEQAIQLQGSINIIPVEFHGDRIAADYLDQALDVRIAENNTSAAFVNQFLAASNIINPFVGLGYSASRSSVGGTKTPWADSASFMVGIEVNIGYSGYSSMHSSIDAYRLQREVLVEERKSVQIQILNYSNQLNDLQSAIRIAQQNVAINRESLTLTQIGYQQGLKTQIELQTAISNVQDAELSLLQSRLDYLTALLNLSALIGTDSEGLIRQAQNYRVP